MPAGTPAVDPGARIFSRQSFAHAIPSFEDQALFAHDVQQALLKLEDEDVQVITLLGFYDLGLEEAAVMLGRSAGCLSQRYAEAVARLTQIFLDWGVLQRQRTDRRQAQMKGRALPKVALPRKKPCGSVSYAGTAQLCPAI